MIPIPPDVLASLAADFGLTPADLSPLVAPNAGSDGATFSCVLDGQPRVFKVLAPSASDPYALRRLDERLQFAYYLGQHGARIVYPLPRPASQALFSTCPAGENLFIAYSMPLAAGHHPQVSEWTPALLRAWGAMVGATHRLTRAYPTWQEVTEDGQQVLGWQQEWHDFYSWCRDPQVKDYWLVMREKLAALPVDRTCFGFIHNDPHMENILVDGDPHHMPDVGPEHLTLLDFDVANCHWFITDISIALQSVLFRQSGGMDEPLHDPLAARRFLVHFMEGYQTENQLDRAWLAQLDLFINYRRALLFTVMQDWIETKPELHARWKNMVLTEAPVFG
jgi:amicoumacin kinase